ncbi:MAG: penicillin-binding transpeptidase domain-containing protein [Candidatus Omnitrophota bacterium]|jgi:cell division protein FtsI (penicillin-binding protein 3)
MEAAMRFFPGEPADCRIKCRYNLFIVVYIATYRRRFNAVFLLFFIFLFSCVIRLLFIQFFRSEYLASIARKQHNLYVELEPRRGAIYDINMRPQAINIPADSLFASPASMSSADKERAVRQLMPILGVDYAYLNERLGRKKYFVWLQRKMTPQQSEEVKKLNIKGIGCVKESKRCYPNGYLASHLVGFAGIDNNGLEGSELLYNKYLKGEGGWAYFLRDARQKRLEIWENMVLPKDGDNIVLTIDGVIQYIAERELDKAFISSNAKGGSIVVMNPHTGAILAMANRPTFDLNEYSSSPRENRRNRAVCDMFEPGSVFKVVAASAALEEKKSREDERFFCENGSYRFSTHVLHDHTAHGWLTFSEVIEQSSNIGTSKIAQKLGPAEFYRYMKLFGFGAKSGVDILGEISGVAKNPRQWSKISIVTMPMGQEIGVTELQLACAFSVIANGGTLMKPYLVSEVRDKYGETIKEFKPQPVRQVISARTAARMRKILTGVIENGTGKLARVQGFTAGGKTGTAQKIDPDGRYSHSKFMASFAGFAPAEEPALVVAVVLDEPHPYYYGGVVASPVFRNVVSDTLRYLKTKQSVEEVWKLNEVKQPDFGNRRIED